MTLVNENIHTMYQVMKAMGKHESTSCKTSGVNLQPPQEVSYGGQIYQGFLLSTDLGIILSVYDAMQI